MIFECYLNLLALNLYQRPEKRGDTLGNRHNTTSKMNTYFDFLIFTMDNFSLDLYELLR